MVSLVINGQIAMSAPDLDESDVQAVAKTLRSGVLALGPEAEAFERACADLAGTSHAVAVSSGTAGLHLIVRALGIGPGDEVLVPSFTFAASVNAILYEGATPVFVDVEPDTLNLNPKEIEARRTPATRAVMVVDVFGHPAEWDEVKQAGAGLKLIDDCCEALGARYRGQPLGGLGRAGCFAFYPNKQITTGEGGMIVTNDSELADLCRSMRNQGRGRMGAWLEHERLGFNYRMDELSAALGRSQFARLDSLLAKRARVAAWYTERIQRVDGIEPPKLRGHVDMSWFVYVVRLSSGIDRGGVIRALEADGIPSRAYFSPIHLQPYIRDRLNIKEGMLPVTEAISQETLALPFHGNLTEGEVDRVVSALVAATNSLS